MFRIRKHERCPIQISINLTLKLVSIIDGHLLVATRCLHWARLQLELCVCVCLTVQIGRYTMKVCRV
jgi:hypothetical protein